VPREEAAVMGHGGIGGGSRLRAVRIEWRKYLRITTSVDKDLEAM
jgi:hypothetical protein